MFFVLFVSPLSAQFFWGNSDFLEQVFSPSKSQQQVINLWNDKTAVGREVINPSMNVDIELWEDPNIDTSTREPLLVRFTKFFLRLTIVLSVTMIIYTGIRYILAAWEEEWVKNARQNLVYIILGILLALMSLGIITLIESVGFSTLSTF
jgi:hypothetical protein